MHDNEYVITSEKYYNVSVLNVVNIVMSKAENFWRMSFGPVPSSFSIININYVR